VPGKKGAHEEKKWEKIIAGITGDRGPHRRNKVPIVNGYEKRHKQKVGVGQLGE